MRKYYCNVLIITVHDVLALLLTCIPSSWFINVLCYPQDYIYPYYC